MKYKVGDKVRIRSWDSMEKEFKLDEDGDIPISSTFFDKNMKNYCGKEVTILVINEDCYRIEDDCGKWHWNDDMFEDVVENKKPLEKIEFGQLEGSPSWAYKVAEKEGEVWHRLRKYVIGKDNKLIRESDGYNIGDDFSFFLTGWHRKPKTDKETLIEEFEKLFTDSTNNVDNMTMISISNILDKYEVRLK